MLNFFQQSDVHYDTEDRDVQHGHRHRAHRRYVIFHCIEERHHPSVGSVGTYLVFVCIYTYRPVPIQYNSVQSSTIRLASAILHSTTAPIGLKKIGRKLLQVRTYLPMFGRYSSEKQNIKGREPRRTYLQ